MRLAISQRNWQLQKLVINQEGKDAGKEQWISFRFYISLESALKDVVHINTSKEKFNSIPTLIRANTTVIEELSKALSPHYKLEKQSIRMNNHEGV